MTTFKNWKDIEFVQICFYYKVFCVKYYRDNLIQLKACSLFIKNREFINTVNSFIYRIIVISIVL